MGTKPFFYICVGLTLSLPLFYLDLAFVEFFEKSKGRSASARPLFSRNFGEAMDDVSTSDDGLFARIIRDLDRSWLW